MPPAEFKSKFAAQPGSRQFGRASFVSQDLAFNPDAVDPVKADARRQVKMAIQPRLLTGAKPDWNNTTYIPNLGRPHRALVRTLSEFQGTRMEYNYRAEELPTLFKQTTVVSKGTKFAVDQTLFLPASMRANLVQKNVTMNDRSELPVSSKLADAAPWDPTTTITVHTAKSQSQQLQQRPGRRRHSKSKSVVQLEGYVPPAEREAAKMEEMRRQKKEARYLAEIRRTSTDYY
jgi:hypothetical protein